MAVAGADALQESAFLVGQSFQAELLDLFQQLVHALLFRLALLDFAQRLAGGTLLQPALDEVGFLLLRRGTALLFEARVALREVAEQGILAARLQKDPLPPA